MSKVCRSYVNGASPLKFTVPVIYDQHVFIELTLRLNTRYAILIIGTKNVPAHFNLLKSAYQCPKMHLHL